MAAMNDKYGESYVSPWEKGGRPMRKRGKNEPLKRRERGPFLIAIIVFVLAMAALSYFAFLRKPAGPSVGIEFQTPVSVLAGDPFSITVSLSNYSDIVLKKVRVSLVLPDGVSFTEQSPEQRVIELAIGDFGPGSTNPYSFNLIVTSGSNVLKHIQAKLIYATDQSASAEFESDGATNVSVGQPAIGLNLTAPQSIFNSQDFTIKAAYINNTNHDFKNLRLQVDYPAIFGFKSSTMQPETGGNNSWDLGTLASGMSGVITITGGVIGPEKSFFNFGASLTSDIFGNTYTINAQTASVAIASAPLSLEIAHQSTPDNAFHLGNPVTYNLNYVNNSDVIMQDVTVSAKLTGAMFDFMTLQTNAYFNSLTNTLNWFAANTPQLQSIAPGGGGSVSFTVRLKNSFPIRLMSDKNYTLRVDAQISSPTVPPNTAANRTISVTSFEDKVAGKVDIAAEAYWRDAVTGILNQGPYPPRVNQPTQYTIHWRIINYATDALNITVSAYLQSGSRFTGTVKSSIDSVPTYNPDSGLVTWQIGSLPATKGITGPPVEAVFQVENVPSTIQLGQNVPLLGETKIEWTDSFVGAVYNGSAMPLDSSIPYDKTITVTDRMVKQ
jgi:hypothetical protein